MHIQYSYNNQKFTKANRNDKPALTPPSPKMFTISGHQPRSGRNMIGCLLPKQHVLVQLMQALVNIRVQITTRNDRLENMKKNQNLKQSLSSPASKRKKKSE